MKWNNIKGQWQPDYLPEHIPDRTSTQVVSIPKETYDALMSELNFLRAENNRMFQAMNDTYNMMVDSPVKDFLGRGLFETHVNKQKWEYNK